MALRYNQVQVQPLANHRYKITKTFRYKDVIVPKGYRTNGADIPRIFWWWTPPNDSQVLPAVIVHDWLCSLGKYELADARLREAMLDLKVPRLKRCPIYYAVRAYTKFIRRSNVSNTNNRTG